MHISNESLLIILGVGLIAGWLAGQIVQGTGFGIVGDLIIGIVGAFIWRNNNSSSLFGRRRPPHKRVRKPPKRASLTVAAGTRLPR
jgi:hypothetical protein